MVSRKIPRESAGLFRGFVFENATIRLVGEEFFDGGNGQIRWGMRGIKAILVLHERVMKCYFVDEEGDLLPLVV